MERRHLILAPCVFTVPAPNSFSSLANFLRPEKCTRFCDLKGPTRELSGRRAACHALLNGGDCRTDKMDSRFLPLYSRCGLFPAFLERRLTQFLPAVRRSTCGSFLLALISSNELIVALLSNVTLKLLKAKMFRRNI